MISPKRQCRQPNGEFVNAAPAGASSYSSLPVARPLGNDSMLRSRATGGLDRRTDSLRGQRLESFATGGADVPAPHFTGLPKRG